MLRQFISTGVMSLLLLVVGCIMFGRTIAAPTSNVGVDGDLINMITSGSPPSPTILQWQQQQQQQQQQQHLPSFYANHNNNYNNNQLKRSWQNLQSAWGKRANNFINNLPDYNSIEDYQEQQLQPKILTMNNINDGDDNSTDMDIPVQPQLQSQQSLQSQLNQQEHDYLMSPILNMEEKRAWKSMNGAWGKRVNSDWNKFRGSWGKREPGWNNLKGLWGKRATWNKLSSAWGKRDSSVIPNY